MTAWAQSLIRISSYEVETLQKRLAEITARRSSAEMRLAVLDAEVEVERELNKRARQCLSAYSNMEELIRIGAYRSGADPIVDRAIALNPALEGFLGQDKDDATRLTDSFTRLEAILNQGMIPQ